MNLSEIRSIVKNLLYEDGVHRSDTFINKSINEGYKLVCLYSLCDERRALIDIEGSRNFNALPRSETAHCVAPVHVSNAHTGTRVNPIRVEDLEVHGTEWEGSVGAQGDALYYLMLSPYHHAVQAMVLCPIQNIGKTQLIIIGAYIPADLSTDTDVPRIAEEYQDLLVLYGHFYGLIGEPRMAGKAQVAISSFMERLGDLVVSVKSRFPSGRDFEPEAPEFSTLGITELDKRERSNESRRPTE